MDSSLPPRNVCPKCGERGCESVRLNSLKNTAPACRPFKCPACGEVSRYCDLKYYTTEEKVEADKVQSAKRVQWNRDHPESRRQTLAKHAPKHRRHMRLKFKRLYHGDPEFKAKHIADGLKWRAENRDRVNESARNYYYNHRYECCLRHKKWRLKKYREEVAAREAG